MCNSANDTFVHYNQCLEIIDNVKQQLTGQESASNDEAAKAEKLNEAFRRIMDHYQEQAALLDTHADELINKLTAIALAEQVQTIRYHTVFKLLYSLIKVRGFKALASRFPHETNKLQPIVDLLERERLEDRANWQTRYVLTVWLSIVILVPFDLAKFGSQTGRNSNQGLASRIEAILLRNLTSHDSCQHATSFALGRFLTRSDTRDALTRFIELALRELNAMRTDGRVDSQHDVKLIGYLRTLAYLYKMKNEPSARQLLAHLNAIQINKIDRELVRHLLVKLTQRVGISLLPNRSANWRYARGKRLLTVSSDASRTVGTNQSDKTNTPDGESAAEGGESSASEASASAISSSVSACNSDLDVTEQLEPLINTMLEGIQDSQTKIRWSAAKGLARITERLSCQLASQIVDSILEMFTDETSEFGWHGACLALAELARYGLVLPDKLDRVCQVIREAIMFDRNKGSFATGTNVRDAACYVCWALARTYDSSSTSGTTELQAMLDQLSLPLLLAQVFDREVQCRRAASAAYQELIGRHGAADPHHLELLTQLDYHSVGQRTVAYIQLSQVLAKYDAYVEPMCEHLLTRKITHWDGVLRRLACNSLAALMLHSKPNYIVTRVIPELVRVSAQNDDHNAKHGAILALGKVCASLNTLGIVPDDHLVAHIASLHAGCAAQLSNKRLAPDFMDAMCQLIISTSSMLAATPGTPQKQPLDAWETLAVSALDSDNNELRELGATALATMCRQYYAQDKTSQDRVLTLYTSNLKHANESTRRGALCGLDQLASQLCAGSQLDCDTMHVIFIALIESMERPTRDTSNDVVYAHAKSDACTAFVDYCRALDPKILIVSSQFLTSGLEALIVCANDYTTDRRGDIGVVIRKSAVCSLATLATLLADIGVKAIFAPDLMQRLMCAVSQQAVALNDAVREAAAHALYKLTTCERLPNIPDHEFIIRELIERYKLNEDFNWRDESTPAFVSLLTRPIYAEYIWRGLLPSLGQTSDAGARQFREALTALVKSIDGATIDTIFSIMCDVLHAEANNDRILVPGLVTIEHLLTSGLLSDHSSVFERLVELCWQHRGAEPKRTSLVAKVLCAMVQFDTCRRQCLSYIIVLLCNKLPHVRAFTANQLYMSLLVFGDEFANTNDQVNKEEVNVEEAMQVLEATNWTEGAEICKQARDKVCRALCVPLPTKKQI